jgi:hypothetical protein
MKDMEKRGEKKERENGKRKKKRERKEKNPFRCAGG